ncbi:hypothetical protein Peur_005471 [Populus x canadensis]
MTSLVDPTTPFLCMICPYLIGSNPPLVLFCVPSVFSKPKNNMPKCIVLIKNKNKTSTIMEMTALISTTLQVYSYTFQDHQSLYLYILKPATTDIKIETQFSCI